MKKTLFLIACLSGHTLFAQDMSFSRPGKTFYDEMPNPAVTSLENWSKVRNDINVSFASDNVRYAKEKVPDVSSETWNATAWKGEKIHTQVLVWSKKNIEGLSVTASGLSGENGGSISSKNVNPAFIRYVMTDEFGNGCGRRKKSDYDSSLVEDPIDIIKTIPVKPNTVQPVWLSIQVPGDAKAGRYNGTVTINADRKYILKISLNVLDHLLPPPGQWKFDLDLWQSPNPVAKVHGVSLWSNEHFKLMESYYRMLAGAGQKTITACIIPQPWGPTHTYYEDPTLIKWTKKKDGSWFYDYSVFDRYISMLIDCGINKHINCYSMISWNLTYIYFDEAAGKNVSVKLTPGTPEYSGYWSGMLKDFTKHLKSKGWFEMAAIAMDERSMESTRAVMALLKEIDPAWKTALAGGYHPEIAEIYDYCVIIDQKFDPELLKKRKAEGKPSTYYTACGERYPNGFTFSPPAENTWICWYALSAGYTGYLRWAYNAFTEDPLRDTRYRTWPAGDCYQIYPGPRSSIRFEKYIEGIQAFEKIRILKEEFAGNGREEKIKELDRILGEFQFEKLKNIPAAETVEKAKESLNQF